MDEFEYCIYDSVDATEDLYQGDILQSSREIRSIFKEVHPHFLDQKYTAFLVLTQTCDLERRGKGQGKECKSRYINLAVVRQLEDVLTALLDRTCARVEICENVVEGVYKERSRGRAEMLLERIFNQNEQAMGIFYLPANMDVRIAVPSVALLQVSVAVRASEHYEALTRSRSGRLRPEFQSKLGWLIGNIFSRVATRDMPKTKRKELIAAFLGSAKEGVESEVGIRWVSGKAVEKAKQEQISIDNLTTDQIVDALSKYKPTPPINTAIGRVVSVIEEELQGATQDQLQKISIRLSNDPLFSEACKK